MKDIGELMIFIFSIALPVQFVSPWDVVFGRVSTGSTFWPWPRSSKSCLPCTFSILKALANVVRATLTTPSVKMHGPSQSEVLH